MIDDLTAKTVRELFHYDPETGALTWRHRDCRWFVDNRACAIWNTRYAETAAGAYSMGYLIVCIFYRKYKVHRIIWLWMTGEWAPSDIDHIDHDPLNNRWANLRAVSRAENQQNQTRSRANTSGVTGVSLHVKSGRWRVDVSRTLIGYFGTFDEAVAARLAAQAAAGYHPNHGEPKKETAPSAER